MSGVANLGSHFVRLRPFLGDGTGALITLHIAQAVLRLGSNLVLTRLVAPEAFGVIAIIMSVSYILTMTTDLGLRAFITRHKTADPSLIRTVWTIRLIRNAGLALVMFSGAGLFANLYSAPEVAPAIRLCSLLLVVDGVSSLGYFSGERERRVLRLSVLDFAKFLLMTAVTLSAAAYLRNYWAIIISLFVGGFFSIYASYRLIPNVVVGFEFNKSYAMDLWRFARYVIPSSLISIFLTQTDKLFFANVFPLTELGKYALAATLVLAIESLITQYFLRVFYPLFAQECRERETVGPEAYYEPRWRITLLLAFGVGGVIGGGEMIVRILFNDSYLGAGLYLSILGVATLSHLFAMPAQQALVAKGFVRATLLGNIIRMSWIVGAGLGAYNVFGPIAVIVAIACAGFVTMPFYWYQLRLRGLLDLPRECAIFAVAGGGAAVGIALTQAILALIEVGFLPSF